MCINWLKVVLLFVTCFSLIDRRGVVVAEDSEHVRVTIPTPPAAATAAAPVAATNEAFTSTTVADVNTSVENQLVS